MIDSVPLIECHRFLQKTKIKQVKAVLEQITIHFIGIQKQFKQTDKHKNKVPFLLMCLGSVVVNVSASRSGGLGFETR